MTDDIGNGSIKLDIIRRETILSPLKKSPRRLCPLFIHLERVNDGKGFSFILTYSFRSRRL